ncbi:MAG: VanZ family protein [Candidatus Fimenecus sp.]
MKIKKLNINFFISWIAVLLILSIIFIFSNENGEKSTLHSNSITNFFLNFLKIEFSPNANFIIRKFAHFSEYTFLGIAFYNAFLNTFETVKIKLPIYAAGFCASLDEIHQYFISSRAATIEDVTIDLLGSIFGIFILYFIIKSIKKCKKKQKSQ